MSCYWSICGWRSCTWSHICHNIDPYSSYNLIQRVDLISNMKNVISHLVEVYKTCRLATYGYILQHIILVKECWLVPSVLFHFTDLQTETKLKWEMKGEWKRPWYHITTQEIWCCFSNGLWLDTQQLRTPCAQLTPCELVLSNMAPTCFSCGLHVDWSGCRADKSKQVRQYWIHLVGGGDSWSVLLVGLATCGLCVCHWKLHIFPCAAVYKRWFIAEVFELFHRGLCAGDNSEEVMGVMMWFNALLFLNFFFFFCILRHISQPQAMLYTLYPDVCLGEACCAEFTSLLFHFNSLIDPAPVVPHYH